MGWAFATQRTTFIALNGDGSSQSVVLQIYDDLAVTAPLVAGSDGKNHIEQTFTIYRLDGLPNQPFRNIDVGPLTTASPR